MGFENNFKKNMTTQEQIPLQKRTKAEVLKEYQNLLENYEELKISSRLLGVPENIKLADKTRDYTIDNLNKGIDSLKEALNNAIGDFSINIMAEAEKLKEINEAVELAKKNLSLQYNIQVAAETLDNLIAENSRKKIELEQEIENKKRSWEREQEEYEYNKNLQRKREEDFQKEKIIKQEKELEERLQDIVQQEQELQNLRKETGEFPKRLENLLAQKESEVIKRLNEQFTERLEQEKKDWQAQKNIYEIKTENLENRIKDLTVEVDKLKKETEKANIKAQELAVKVIEGSCEKSINTKKLDTQ